jgi:hypothetical protein
MPLDRLAPMIPAELTDNHRRATSPGAISCRLASPEEEACCLALACRL